VVFWQVEEHPLDAVESIPVPTDPAKTLSTAWKESTSFSKDLSVRRLQAGNDALWIHYEAADTSDSTEDLTVLQGSGPILIDSGASSGLIQILPTRDGLEEPVEVFTFRLLPGADYQLGYPAEMIFAIENAPAPATPPDVPPKLVLLADPMGGALRWNLKVSGIPEQMFQIETSEDLRTWMAWKTGTLSDPSEEFSVNNGPHSSQRFFRMAPNHP